jgi:hypothetical protein
MLSRTATRHCDRFYSAAHAMQAFAHHIHTRVWQLARFWSARAGHCSFGRFLSHFIFSYWCSKGAYLAGYPDLIFLGIACDQLLTSRTRRYLRQIYQ